VGKLKSIMTNKITIGISCFILGGIIFGGIILGRTSGVDITQERYSQLLEMEKKVLAANTNDSKEEAKKDNTNKNTTKDNPKESIEFKVGETAYLTDANGVKVMSLTIDGAKLIEERNRYSDKQADKDASGNVLETYPAGGKKYPQAISKGKKCSANMSFALNNESNELEIEYYENRYNSKPTGKFKITCE